MSIKPNNTSEMNKLSSKMTFDMTLHGVLLWASLGFLMPAGVLVIRMSNTSISRSAESSATRLRIFFYSHLILQILSVLLSTTGAVMAMKSFENSFSNNHQRLGLFLHCAIWVQAVLGFFRPLKGNKKRGAWYILHWLLGTLILAMGIINTYIGLQAYQRKTSKNMKVWIILFTVQVSFMAAFYLFQDKWCYIKKQRGGIFRDEPVRPSSTCSDEIEISNARNSINGATDDDDQHMVQKPRT